MNTGAIAYIILISIAAAGIAGALMHVFVKRHDESQARASRLDRRAERAGNTASTGATVVNRPSRSLPDKADELFDIDRTERPSVAPSSHPVYAQVTQSVQQFPVRSLRERRREDDTDTDIDIITK